MCAEDLIRCCLSVLAVEIPYSFEAKACSAGKIPCSFSLLAGNLDAETGSMATASATNVAVFFAKTYGKDQTAFRDSLDNPPDSPPTNLEGHIKAEA